MYFLTVLEVGKSKIKMLADSVPSESLFLACRQPPPCCVLIWWGWGRGRWDARRKREGEERIENSESKYSGVRFCKYTNPFGPGPHPYDLI